ncbi:hypothetical protein TNCT_291761 [Trichonephila clavata]|uniref:Secreted protein n=1 Tax=Trichonephila clavata TaxID=2740835 RepID=A0A8X6GR41_TRICU|nr:hypothetical protein TNCT_291761 [Trichonephila clavata]
MCSDIPFQFFRSHFYLLFLFDGVSLLVSVEGGGSHAIVADVKSRRGPSLTSCQTMEVLVSDIRYQSSTLSDRLSCATPSFVQPCDDLFRFFFRLNLY